MTYLTYLRPPPTHSLSSICNATYLRFNSHCEHNGSDLYPSYEHRHRLTTFMCISPCRLAAGVFALGIFPLARDLCPFVLVVSENFVFSSRDHRTHTQTPHTEAPQKFQPQAEMNFTVRKGNFRTGTCLASGGPHESNFPWKNYFPSTPRDLMNRESFNVNPTRLITGTWCRKVISYLIKSIRHPLSK